MNEKLNKLKKTVKRHAPAVVISSAATAAVIYAIYQPKTLLEVTAKNVDYLRENGGAFIYETKLGDIMVTVPKHQ